MCTAFPCAEARTFPGSRPPFPRPMPAFRFFIENMLPWVNFFKIIRGVSDVNHGEHRRDATGRRAAPHGRRTRGTRRRFHDEETSVLGMGEHLLRGDDALHRLQASLGTRHGPGLNPACAQTRATCENRWFAIGRFVPLARRTRARRPGKRAGRRGTARAGRGAEAAQCVCAQGAGKPREWALRPGASGLPESRDSQSRPASRRSVRSPKWMRRLLAPMHAAFLIDAAQMRVHGALRSVEPRRDALARASFQGQRQYLCLAARKAGLFGHQTARLLEPDGVAHRHRKRAEVALGEQEQVGEQGGQARAGHHGVGRLPARPPPGPAGCRARCPPSRRRTAP